ncbi:MAG TPA: TonB-dependent receptor plug domain-containing protein, partial [Rhodocyclaceae bacterium]|nr:TonB-dependent receptor plug domain-containing protein [Rhodocyclaceae bacterium]
MSKSIRMTALSVALAAAWPALAQTASSTLPDVIVTANGIPTKDADATYVSEVHNRAEIEASGASSLYDFLSQYTSLNVMSGYGNKNAPVFDMRGYGIGNGAQSTAIYVDGRRLNEVDLANPLLGSIPLGAIDSIEISKGSGSVAFGDSAMAGVINIRTRAYNGVTVSAISGSRGLQSLTSSAGLSRELFDFSASASNDKQGYSSDRDVTGERDGSTNRTEQAKFTLKPLAGLKLFVEGMNADIDTRYVSSLSPAQFNSNPQQNAGNTYTHQHFEARQMRVGAEYEIIKGLTARYAHNREDKSSAYLGAFGSITYYDYSSDDLSLNYSG